MQLGPLVGPPVWDPCVGPLCGTPLGPLCGTPVWDPCAGSLWGPCAGPLCGTPVWDPCVGPLRGTPCPDLAHVVKVVQLHHRPLTPLTLNMCTRTHWPTFPPSLISRWPGARRPSYVNHGQSESSVLFNKQSAIPSLYLTTLGCPVVWYFTSGPFELGLSKM